MTASKDKIIEVLGQELRRRRRWSVEGKLAMVRESLIRHMPKPDRATALRNLAIPFEHYNEENPHSALKYCALWEFRRLVEALA